MTASSTSAIAILPSRLGRVVAVACLHLMVSAAVGQVVSEVRVSQEATIQGERVSLADIASLPKGTEAVVGRISLGYSPNLGVMRKISCGQIRTAMDAAGITESKIRLVCSGEVRVLRAGQEITEAVLREAIEAAVKVNTGSRVIESRIVRAELPRPFQVPIGNVELTPRWPSAANVFAPFSLPIDVKVNGKLVRSISASLEIEAYSDVLAASRDISINASLDPQDVKLQRTRLSRPIADYVSDPTDLRGTGAVRRISAGSPITADALAAVAVVRPGDAVKIEAASGGLKLIVAGEARSGGRIGDRVSVKNVQSGAIVQGVIADKGLVRVSF